MRTKCPPESHRGGLTKLARIPVLIVDEVGYIPFGPEAANLFFQLVSSRYERASGRWGEVFGEDVVAAVISTGSGGSSLAGGDVSRWTGVHDSRRPV